MSGKTYLRDQQFFKPNYYEAIKYILPSYLYEDDIQTTPKDSDPVDLIINSHISIANNISSVLPISSIPDTIYSSLANFNGISPFFVKQNNLTNITTKTFEDKVLYYFNKTFNDFSTSSELSSYLESTILPGIALNNPDTSAFADIGESSAIQVYLVNELSWMYMLNTTGVHYDPSSYIRDEIVSKLYNATPFRIDDGIKGLVEHVWRNDLTDYYPTSLFASSSEYHLSGTQQLEKLKTWVEVIYSPLYADRSDFTVKDRFDIFYDNSTTYVNKIESGPFARLIRALSFFAFDINNETEQISTLYDIDDCPDDYLPLIAQLIGWDLFGNDPARWRLQLRSAIPVYKAIGTKEATQRAINTIFPRGVFPIEGRLTELWESYIPYLIYYALATESEYFKDYSTWTSELANGMGVTRYSSTSMDENIKLAVDRIIYETVYRFPSSFNTEFWPEKFNYRSRDYPIPPFEEYPYYANVELNNEMIRFMTDRLVCFGVNQDFALDVSSYLYNNSLNTDDQPRRGSWLLFTSGYNEPSNLSSLITNINDKRFEYVSLWSGKSSHFKLVLDASEFDFANTGFNNTATKDAVTVVSKAVRNSAPAHSIPLISLEVSGDSDVLSLSHDMLPSVWVDKVEIDNGATNNYYSKALNLNSYKRSVNESGTVIGRNATANSVTPEILNGTYETANLGRKTLRRRSYEKIMPFNGYYDRTGFNMPAGYGVGFDTLSSTHTLGLIPSSLQFVPVSSHINLPPIWSQCETLNSRNYYYEYPVSGTFPARDRNEERVTRGSLPGIYAVMHRVKERQKYLQAYLDYDLSSVETSGDLVSYANAMQNFGTSAPGLSATYSSSSVINNLFAFPTSHHSYYDFEFSRDIHRLYHIYKNNFQWHRLSQDVREMDGANIFSHAFGPTLYNHSFEEFGTNFEKIVASSIGSVNELTWDNDYFVSIGSYEATSVDGMIVGSPELVSSGILSGVELVHTSGSNEDSSFALFRVPSNVRTRDEDPYMFDKTFIMMRSGFNAIPRIRFDISKYQEPSNHPISNNFLIPDMGYKFSFDYVISRDSGNILGGRAAKVWIHTKPELGKMWSYTPSKAWVQHDASVTREDVLSRYSHTKLYPQRNIAGRPSDPTNLQCLQEVRAQFKSPVSNLKEEYFDTFTVEFNTDNRELVLPRQYQSTYNQLHRIDQEYVIEILLTPRIDSDQYLLLDKVNLQNTTLKKLTEIFASGKVSNPLCRLSYPSRECTEYRVELTKEDLFEILKHFNNITGKNSVLGYASRDATETGAIMGSSGGSKLDYRLLLEGLSTSVPNVLGTDIPTMFSEVLVDI